MNRSFVYSFRKLFHCSLCHTHKNRLPQARRYISPFCCTVTEFHQGKLKMYTNSIDFFYMTSWRVYRVFSHDVKAAILVSQNNETAAMLVSQTSPLGVELFCYANTFFCSNKFA